MSIGTVNANNLISQSWNNCYSVLNTISDPSNRGKQWIFSSFPLQKKGTANTYPCIIIESANMRGNITTFGQSNTQYTWDIPISIHATRMDTVDGLASTVISTLNSCKGSFETNSMHLFNIESTPTFHNIISSNIIHEKRINVTFQGYL
jgi:hypothetical protein